MTLDTVMSGVMLMLVLGLPLAGGVWLIFWLCCVASAVGDRRSSEAAIVDLVRRINHWQARWYQHAARAPTWGLRQAILCNLEAERQHWHIDNLHRLPFDQAAEVKRQIALGEYPVDYVPGLPPGHDPRGTLRGIVAPCLPRD